MKLLTIVALTLVTSGISMVNCALMCENCKTYTLIEDPKNVICHRFARKYYKCSNEGCARGMYIQVRGPAPTCRATTKGCVHCQKDNKPKPR
ncbi:hypothetical protein PGT21_016797 [Puccinia graminis f. sp. tritici]|uniref:Uncharacterized protein n=1 Tax=Puccinia graminis f. sp. tritici TaxID=56615 RepID=A0A5B0RWV5_PUCGR|nr:hypothetical protein PGT21_016797 [Puccinia graminis f. sp. tritici]KAA1093477.1 hypothetical protein PGTUg99_020858 [Puccinia graminis f. sp. tritici]KAA1129625.1 hypothetical protein PGTUg99_032504 [Puccinia graminis f. sp. tritici]